MLKFSRLTKLRQLIQKTCIRRYSTNTYDLLVIGGGSGGLACSKRAVIEAKKLGRNIKVGVLDFVTPSPRGTKWGLGGTCVNVGCIPKKLMHTASLLAENIKLDANSFGLQVEYKQHNWNEMVQNVNNYIKSLNFGYRADLIENGVKYLNMYARFIDNHTIEATDSKGNKQILKAETFVVAAGGRPQFPDIPGAIEYGISSDDIFSLKTPPGKTLVVGASYVSLECAGFLTGLGFDVTVMIRSVPLRGFDQECAEKIVSYMQDHGTKFVRYSTPTLLEKIDNGRIRVTWYNANDKTVHTDIFDTVLFATGRKGESKKLGLDRIGVKIDNESGKVEVNEYEQSSIPNIYAIGDIMKNPANNAKELTPVAIQTGSLLAKRLYGDAGNIKMDYDKVPTTVFTPIEYGSCGLSEEDAIKRYGLENIEVYHINYTPLEWELSHRDTNKCFMKMICNKQDNERVIGFHVVAPHAGEITQGVAVAMKMNATKHDFDSTIGIHPTVAEEMTTLKITKSSGQPAEKRGC